LKGQQYSTHLTQKFRRFLACRLFCFMDSLFDHLGSRHRLSTKLNFYGGWWTDYLLGDIQDYILVIIKNRAEAVAQPNFAKAR